MRREREMSIRRCVAVMALAPLLTLGAGAIATAGIAGRLLGTDRTGDVLTLGTAFVLVGIAMAAVFAFLGLTHVLALTRKP